MPLLQTTVSTQMPDFPPTTFARSESSSVRRVSADSVSFFAPSITALLASATSPNETSTSHEYTQATRNETFAPRVLRFATMLGDADREGWSVLVLDLQLDTTTPAGRFAAITMANAAEFERRQIGERTRVALAAKKARGARLGRPRRTPDDVLERVVRERDSGRTWRAIAEALNAEMIPTTRSGAEWRVSTVQAAYRSHVLDAEAQRSAISHRAESDG
jgi:Resolvase, N terminal domain